jgi:HlyD family secretion protein
MATVKKQKKRRRKWVILGVIILALGGMGVAALMQKREPMLMVETQKVERRDLTETVLANGRIQPVVQVKISAEVSGEIIELPVKEGQEIKKGDLLVRIKPDVYVAAKESAEAGYLSSISGKNLSEANLRKATAEFQRNKDLYDANLVPETTFVEYKTALEVASAQVETATHQVAVAKASLARAEEELNKTSIFSPLNGTVSQLNSELGERVVGTAMMTGTEIMTVADLDQMEARVDIGEIDIPLIALGQKANLEVDAFRDKEFKGTVSEISNSAKGLSTPASQSQEGTKFEVRIRIDDRGAFRPGMTVTAEVETRYRTNVLAVPIQSVTTRPPKKPEEKLAGKADGTEGTNEVAGVSEEGTSDTNEVVEVAESDEKHEADEVADAASVEKKPKKSRKDGEKKPGSDEDKERPKHVEVLFVVEGDVAKMVPVKRGISDDEYTEIEEGLTEGQVVVTGGYKVISKDLEDGKKVQSTGSSEGEKST